MKKFEVISEFSPKGDQPNAIKKLKNGISSGKTFQTLKGITAVSYTHLTLPTILRV